MWFVSKQARCRGGILLRRCCQAGGSRRCARRWRTTRACRTTSTTACPSCRDPTTPSPKRSRHVFYPHRHRCHIITSLVAQFGSRRRVINLAPEVMRCESEADGRGVCGGVGGAELAVHGGDCGRKSRERQHGACVQDGQRNARLHRRIRHERTYAVNAFLANALTASIMSWRLRWSR